MITMLAGLGTGELAVLLIFGLPIVAVVGGVLIEALKIIFVDDYPKKTKRFSADDSRIIQEIHQGLQRMEKRIDAVETIVLDRATKGNEALDKEWKE
jgi:phage shock protein B